MTSELIIATTNKGKIKEFKQLLEGNGTVIKSLFIIQNSRHSRRRTNVSRKCSD